MRGRVATPGGGTARKTLLQRITTIPILGAQIVAPLLALGPPLLIVGPIFGWSETRGTMVAFSILSVPWLLWLQRRAGIVITLPLLRIPLLYVTPVWFLIGLTK